MKFGLDSGKFPQMNYNRVIARAKRVVRPNRKAGFVITRQQVMGMYNVAQDMNSLVEPQLALKGKAWGEKREGLI